MLKYLRSLSFVALLFFTIAVSPTFAAQTASLLPVSEGNYLQWNPKSGTTHYTMVDETTCNGTTDHNSTTTIGRRDSYGISVASIPDGSTITQIDLTPCASKNSSGGTNSTMNLFYRLNGVNSADAGSYTVTGTTPSSLATTSFASLSTVKSSTTTLEAGAVYTAGNRGLRLSRMAALITYTPLATPSGLTTSASLSAVTLNWTDTSSNEDGFRIERSDNGGAYVEINTVGANVQTYNDTGLTGGTYSYRVRAYNAGGNSGYSNFSVITILNAPSSLNVVTASPSISLTWVDNSTNESGFYIERRYIGGSFSVIKIVSANTTATFDTSSPLPYVYEYRVRAYYNSIYSDYSNIDVTNVLRLPTGLTAVAAGAGTGTINLNWYDYSYTPDEQGYKIERKDSINGVYADVGSVGSNASTFSDSSLSIGTTYYYRIRAFSADDTSAYSATASATAL